MNISTDFYAHHNNLNRIPPGVKLSWGILTMILSLLSPSPIIPIIVAILMSFIIVFIAGVPSRYYLKFVSVPFAFGFLTLILMSLFFGVKPSSIGFSWFRVYLDGLHTGFLAFSRIMGGFTCLAFLSLTTPINEIFKQLEKIKVPRIIIEIALLMYRMIFIFLEEASTMYNAQETRLGYNSIRNSIKSLGLLASNLFIRSWLQGEKVYQAMEARCYNGEIPTMKIHETDKKWIILVVVFEVTLLFGVYFTRTIKII
ncbi:MAG TPA: cobalt ECF transporter T component CbiQ [Methanothermobacter sp.]|jgi:cobalt/nickel transport system permease protein|uniref:Cobalt ECF transporter T component CbiQ n=1 Tax=Methanothermobacter tenebrarum TaxID=680118 RepID=A0ABM7YEH5_9EURY|nr:cobalt ECF transporter T component CbiQ [Methanothermobacter tenebrarum]MDI6881411.1 cobalt ECF transporter T component CbiQ [Methanothermobacter sp.]MDX9692989.1 cobalt ECF transporter T component CbiQ [Methanothermobacter sp.]BDH79685.1 cobalt ECF transporter T component CbiQ [Methanothermobacter tenebrarum]HHW16672.1 cobalt ECF transporter T component CbiQ [Methanothermobacter sp.]HOQ20371.1 cobalt ECF transporter T component CbiQ [Methanothermobacter sp.]